VEFFDPLHFFKLSDEEAMLLTGRTTITDAAADLQTKTNSIFAITLGKEGTLLGINQRTLLVPSIPVQPVDTTGAGDAFVGAVLYQLSQHEHESIQLFTKDQWIKIIANGNKAGARTCEWLGAMEAFKHLSNDIIR
jgi:fructokinase